VSRFVVIIISQLNLPQDNKNGKVRKQLKTKTELLRGTGPGSGPGGDSPDGESESMVSGICETGGFYYKRKV